MSAHKIKIPRLEEAQIILNWNQKNQKRLVKNRFKAQLNGQCLNSLTPHYQILPNVTPSEREMIVDWT